jgi:hypothetical protein
MKKRFYLCIRIKSLMSYLNTLMLKKSLMI